MDCYCIQILIKVVWDTYRCSKYVNPMPDLTMYNPDSYTIATVHRKCNMPPHSTELRRPWPRHIPSFQDPQSWEWDNNPGSVRGPGAAFSRGHFNLEWQLPRNHRYWLPVTPQILGELRWVWYHDERVLNASLACQALNIAGPSNWSRGENVGATPSQSLSLRKIKKLTRYVNKAWSYYNEWLQFQLVIQL